MGTRRGTRYGHLGSADAEAGPGAATTGLVGRNQLRRKDQPDPIRRSSLDDFSRDDDRFVDLRVEDLLHSARQVLAGQGRVRYLLEPCVAGPGGASLAALLPHVPAVAREFTDAGTVGLGVIVPGQPFRFVEDLPPDAAAGAGPPPEIVGLAGRLVVEGRPLRLRSAVGHPALLGFPDDHHQAVSFLGAPVRLQERVGGYLYVADKRGADEFTAEDEALVGALAAVTAIGVDEPRLLEDCGPAAVATLTSPCCPLRLLVRAARRLADTDTAAVVLPADRGALRVASADGHPWAGVVGQFIPARQSVSALALHAGRTVLVNDAATDPRTTPATSSTGIGPLLAAPLLTCGQVRGVLTLGRSAGNRVFDDADVDVVAALTAYAGLLVDLTWRRPQPGLDNSLDAGPGDDPADLAAHVRADVQRRLVVYGATLHALVPRSRRCRVLTELLRQAQELHQQVQRGMAAIRHISAIDQTPAGLAERSRLHETPHATAARPASPATGDDTDFTTRLAGVRHQLQELTTRTDDQLATRVLGDVLDDLGVLLDGAPPREPAVDTCAAYSAPPDPAAQVDDRSADQRLRIAVDRSRGCSVIHLVGSLWLGTASAVSTAVANELADAPAGVVIDLSGVALGDELGLNVLAAVARRAERERGIRVVVAAPPAAVLPHLRRMAAEVDIVDTLPAAIQALHRDRDPRTFRLRLPFDQTAGLQARRLAEHACLSWRQEHVCDDVQLITTELVGNAIHHGLAPVELTIARRKQHLRIQVADGAPQPPALLGPAHAAARRGLGLVLIDTLSTDWGCRQTPTGKVVWATIRSSPTIP